MNKKTILILTAQFGAGHISAANAIKELLLEHSSNYNIIIKNFIDASVPIMNKPMVKLYESNTKYTPGLYNYYYYLKKSFDPKLDLSNKIYTPNLIEYILDVSPDLIISTFPLAASCVDSFKHKYTQKTIPTITVITDVVDSLEWIFSSTDMYFVPSLEIKNRFMQKGINPDKVKVTGVPINKKFFNLEKTKSEKYRLLLLGGGRGLFDFSENFIYYLDEILNYNSNLEITIVTGKNKKLFKTLTIKKPLKNIKVLGFVDNMPSIIKNCDLLITKPGGATVFESIHSTTPVIVRSPKIGQEIENAKFIIDKGIGLIYNDEDDLKILFENLVSKKLDSTIEFMKENITNLKTTFEYDKICEYIVSFFND